MCLFAFFRALIIKEVSMVESTKNQLKIENKAFVCETDERGGYFIHPLTSVPKNTLVKYLFGIAGC